MQIDEFITKCKEWCKKTDNTDGFTIGTDMGINTKLTVDEDGFIWVRYEYTFKRFKSTVNVSNIVEFRLCDFDEKCFYIICSDNTGFCVEENELYYYIDGESSGWGTAAEFFEEFPDGIVDSSPYDRWKL